MMEYKKCSRGRFNVVLEGDGRLRGVLRGRIAYLGRRRRRPGMERKMQEAGIVPVDWQVNLVTSGWMCR